jgi:hypothetical protein
MKIKVTILLLLSFFLLNACNNPANKTNRTSSSGEAQKTPDIASETMDSTFFLLQGKWQSLDDENNFLIFENKLRKEIGEGMESYDIEPFTLSDKCINESDKENEVHAEKSRYISCPESDLCWYIIELNKTTLTLSYMSRGNTLTYKRIE